MDQIFKQITNYLDSHKIVLFMKGTKDMPMCGFSGKVVHILQLLGVDFLDIDILEEPNMREGIKQFTNWPTIPQLYINKQFIGGCDIVSQLYNEGELQKLLQQ
jgi:monothiol glutaredoxin